VHGSRNARRVTARDKEHMPETNEPNPVQQFRYHVCAVCGIAAVAMALGIYQPSSPAPLALLPITELARRIETFNKTDWPISTVVLDVALGLMTANIIAFWT